MDSSLEDLEAPKELYEIYTRLMDLPHFVSSSKKDSVVDDTIVDVRYSRSFDI